MDHSWPPVSVMDCFLTWLKNSLNPSGAYVNASDAALYSTLYPCCRSSVHSHLSSPGGGGGGINGISFQKHFDKWTQYENYERAFPLTLLSAI